MKIEKEKASEKTKKKRGLIYHVHLRVQPLSLAVANRSCQDRHDLGPRRPSLGQHDLEGFGSNVTQ